MADTHIGEYDEFYMTVPSTPSEIQTTQYSGRYTNNGVVSVIAWFRQLAFPDVQLPANG